MGWSMDEEKEVLLLQCMEGTASFEAKARTLGCIGESLCTFDKMYHSICGEEVKRVLLNFWGVL